MARAKDQVDFVGFRLTLKIEIFVKAQISYLRNIWRSWELQDLENDEKTYRTPQKITKIEILRLTKNEPESLAKYQK